MTAKADLARARAALAYGDASIPGGAVGNVDSAHGSGPRKRS